jgi:hypothetical protein
LFLISRSISSPAVWRLEFQQVEKESIRFCLTTPTTRPLLPALGNW